MRIGPQACPRCHSGFVEHRVDVDDYYQCINCGNVYYVHATEWAVAYSPLAMPVMNQDRWIGGRYQKVRWSGA